MNDLVTYVRIRIAATRTERGASAVEYGLLVALIAVIIIVGVTALGGNIGSIFTNTASKVGTGA